MKYEPTEPSHSTDSFAAFEARGPETLAFEEQQTKRAVELLHGHPQFASVLARVKEALAEREPRKQVAVRGPVTFSLEKLPASDEMAVFREAPGHARVVLFQTSKEAAAQRTRIDLISVSPSGRWIAVGTSEGGKEQTTIRVLDARTGADHGDRCEDLRLQELTWFPDDSGFLYLRGRGHRNAPASEQFKDLSIALHAVGSAPGKDLEIVGSQAPGASILRENDYMRSVVSPDGTYVAVGIKHGIIPEMEVFAKKRDSLSNFKENWTRVYSVEDRVTSIAMHNGKLLAVRALGKGGVVEETPFTDPKAHNVLYRSELPLDSVTSVGNDTYVLQTQVSMKRLLRVTPRGEAAPVPLQAAYSVFADNLTVDPTTGDLAFEARSWTEPPSFWRASKKGAQVERLSSGAASSPFEVNVIEVAARDGESIPVTIVQRAGAGGQPPKYVWFHVYGSYGFVTTPNFTPARREFLEHGGTFAIVHVRGGGEKGREWHAAGRGANKIRAVYDFIDVVKALRERGFGTGGGIMVGGASAGAIPVGGLVVREPKLVDAALVEYGILNLSRLEGTSAIGDMQRDEFGTVTTPDGATHVHEVDAFLNVKDGVAYPPALLIAGTDDIRVPCWQSDKFAARLQQANSSHNPILLRLEGAGHVSGQSSDEASASAAETVVFALSQLHHPDFPPLAVR